MLTIDILIVIIIVFRQYFYILQLSFSKNTVFLSIDTFSMRCWWQLWVPSSPKSSSIEPLNNRCGCVCGKRAGGWKRGRGYRPTWGVSVEMVIGCGGKSDWWWQEGWRWRGSEAVDRAGAIPRIFHILQNVLVFLLYIKDYKLSVWMIVIITYAN